jgi:hypothetical protein
MLFITEKNQLLLLRHNGDYMALGNPARSSAEFSMDYGFMCSSLVSADV